MFFFNANKRSSQAELKSPLRFCAETTIKEDALTKKNCFGTKNEKTKYENEPLFYSLYKKSFRWIQIGYKNKEQA